LEGYLNEMGGRYEMERQRNAALTANGPNIAPNVVEQLRLAEEKMSKITVEFQRLQG
jgi:Mn-dependent DtxR family transcriptional regulator